MLTFIERLLTPKKYRVFTTEYDRVMAVKPDVDGKPILAPAPPPKTSEMIGRRLVTILIDHSGSMRGRPIGMVMEAVDTLTERCEHAGLDYEVLGFTTRSWWGGQAFKDWAKDRQASPGRVSELLHLVYRDAGNPSPDWRDCFRTHFNTPGTLKENIDGEALEWAEQRACAMSADQWTLVVISDGMPTDEATKKANGLLSGTRYTLFTRHLEQVVARLHNTTGMRLAALGIGYDVSQFYETSAVVARSEDVRKESSALADQLELSPTR